MIVCSNCQHQNSDDAKFCNNCGTALDIVCPNCGKKNPPGANFCNNCGYKLGLEGQFKVEQTPATPRADVQGLMPKAYAAKLKSARASQAMVGERRIVTMLFCDIKGSTAAAQHLDPEEWAEVINQAFEYMITPVYKYEGTVARLMGDAILAFFGAPEAHEDDPRRAVLAGLDIVTGIRPFKEKVAQDWGMQIDVRVGINTGLVMVGQVGSDLQMEYTALGDAINLAARMEQTAQPGTVQISLETYERVAPLFEFEDLGEVAVKGRAEPVHAYRPLRLKGFAGPLRGIEGMDSPLVGRTTQLESLSTVVSDLEHGNGGIVFLIGEAGLGKSRLIQEIAPAEVSARNGSPTAVHQWFETASLSYETTQAYALFQRLLRRLWHIAPNDAPDAIREKIEVALSGYPDEQEIFQTLLGVESQQGSTIREGEAFKRALYKAMYDLWERETSRSPVVLVLDDLHWTDPASVELIKNLLRLTDYLPLLLLFALRPDRDVPAWQIKQTAERSFPHRLTIITLRALAEDDTSTLVDNLLEITDLPLKLRQQILDKTDGNPLFVEEVVRSLIDRGLVVEDSSSTGARWRIAGDIELVDIPGNIQTLLIARIDRLETAARRTLQLASVIGRSFYYSVLAAIHGIPMGGTVDLDDELIALQRKELIRQAARLPEPEYLFRHVLTQEAAYSTILLRERRKFHCRVGEAIEALFPDRLEEFYPVLARHFGQADDPRAFRYETLAGDGAFRLFAIPEAQNHYARALEIIRREGLRPSELTQDHADLSADEDAETLSSSALIHLFLRHGRCLELQSDHVAALQNYAELESVARERENVEMLLAALLAQATLFAIPSPVQDADRGQALADEALLLARGLGDQEAEAKLLWVFMLLLLYSGFMSAGIPFGRRSIELARQLDMREQLAYSLQDLGLAYISVGHLGQADAVLQEARSLWKTLNNLPLLAENWANAAYLSVMRGEFDQAVAMADKSISISKSIENDWGQVNARAFVALVYVARGEVDYTLDLVQGFISDAQRVGHPGHILGWFQLTWLYVQLGIYDQAWITANEGLEASTSFLPFRPVSLAMLARERMRRADFDGAGELLEEAAHSGTRKILQIIDLMVDMVTVEYFMTQRDFEQAQENLTILMDKLRESGTRYILPNAWHLQSVLQYEQGEIESARGSLEAARAAAEQIEAPILLWQYRAELGEYEAAQEIVDSIADNISDTALRQTFLDFVRSKFER